MLRDPLPELEDDHEDTYYDHIEEKFDENWRPVYPPEMMANLPRKSELAS